MASRQVEMANAPLPSPFPESWYFVASRRAVLKAKLIRKTWMGEEIVVWCDNSGRICVSGAYCPHLGSDLGPEAGGRVCNGRLVCPFHGFEYDATGQCVATPYADPPRDAKLEVFETQEIDGLIFAWWRVQGGAPQWSLPSVPGDKTDWSYLDLRAIRIPSHPQETTENSVDMAHFRYVHGYESMNRVGSVSVDGPYLESRFAFKSTRKIAKFAKFTLDLSATTHVFGLGYSFVEIREHSIGMECDCGCYRRLSTAH